MPAGNLHISRRKNAPNALLRIGERVRGNFGVSPAAKTIKLTPERTLEIVDEISASIRELKPKPALVASKKEEKPLLWKGPGSGVDAGWGVSKLKPVSEWLGRETVRDVPAKVSIEVKELLDGKIVSVRKVKGEVLDE